MSFPPVASLVPHAATMLLLDRIVAVDSETLCAELTIRADSLFCDGFQVGAWVGIEYMAQAIAAHAGHGALLRGEPVKIGFLLGARRYQAHVAGFAVGAVLRVHVQRVLQGENGLGAFDCRIGLAAQETQGTKGTQGEPPRWLAEATVTVFQPADAAQFLQDSMNGKTV